MNASDADLPPRIGILDSGVGGLSVLREIRKLLPRSPIHYVGDSAWCPYGSKSPERICERVTEITDYLLGHGAAIVVIACNSATIHAVGSLRASYPVPIVGMEPAVKPAAALTRSGVVGVLATEASLAGEKFHRLLDVHAHEIRVITLPCPRFVELVEAGVLTGPEAENAVDDALRPLLEAGADVFVLGCTHYPFLRPVIESRLPEGMTVVDTGPAVARRVASLLPPPDDTLPEGDVRIETTGSLELLAAILPRLLPDLAPSLGACPV
ncbi:MAG: glutamate racemase [Verrucomicrobiales bacterium]